MLNLLFNMEEQKLESIGFSSSNETQEAHEPIVLESILKKLIIETECLFANLKRLGNKNPSREPIEFYKSACASLKILFEDYFTFFVDCEKFFDADIHNDKLDIVRAMGLIIKTILLFMSNKKSFESYWERITNWVRFNFVEIIKTMLLSSDWQVNHSSLQAS